MTKPDSSLKAISASTFIFTDSERDGYGNVREFEARAHTFVFSDGSVWNLIPANHSIMNTRDEQWIKIFPEASL